MSNDENAHMHALPKGWAYRQLVDIAVLERGKFSARPRNDPRFFGGAYPFIQTGDVSRSNGTISTHSQSLNEEGLRISRLFPTNTLFFTIAANIGDVAIAPFATCCPDSLVAFTLNQSTDQKWLYHMLSSRKQTFEGLATQNAQLNINLEKLRPYVLPVPPLDEQRAIAAALNDVDALIEALDRLIAKKRDLKQAAMQQLLTGKTRLPGFSGEWKLRRLGDHVRFLRNGTNSRAELSDSGPVRYLHYGDIHTSSAATLHVELLPMSRLCGEKARALDRLSTGDLVFADASEDLDGVGKSVEIVIPQGLELVAGLHTIAARFDKDVLADGFKAYLQFVPPFRVQLLRLAAGTKVYATSRRHLADISVHLPGVVEQAAIATILSDMDAELTTLEQRRDKTRLIKQGMMQELLTGRTRLV